MTRHLVRAQPTPAPTSYEAANFCFYAVSNSSDLNTALSQVSMDTRACEVFFTIGAEAEYQLDQEYTMMYGSVHLDANALATPPVIYAAPGTR